MIGRVCWLVGSFMTRVVISCFWKGKNAIFTKFGSVVQHWRQIFTIKSSDARVEVHTAVLKIFHL